jgi:hypothetical protein
MSVNIDDEEVDQLLVVDKERLFMEAIGAVQALAEQNVRGRGGGSNSRQFAGKAPVCQPALRALTRVLLNRICC